MNREREFAKNTFILTLGRFLPQITSFITLPILTGQLSKMEYGTYDLITTLIMLILPIATLQIQSAAFRFLIECRDNIQKSAEIITNIFWVTIPISVICGIVIQYFFSNYSIIIRILISLYFIFDTIQLTLAQVVRGLGHNKDYTISSCLLSFVNMLGIITYVYILRIGLFGVMLSLLSAQIIAISYYIIRNNLRRYIDIHLVSVNKIKELLSYSWPMVPNNLSNWVLKLSDRLVITAFIGVEANAVYAVANKIPNLLAIGQSVIAMAWQENASIAVNDKDANNYFTKIFDTIFSLMLGCTAILIGFIPIIFKILIRGNYSEAYYQMPILILGMFFYCMSAFEGGIYIAHKKTKSVGITTMVAAAINLVIDLLFVNVIGITAGSVSTLVAYFALYYCRMFDLLKFQKVDFRLRKQFHLLFFTVIMLFISFINRPLLNVFNLLFGLIFAYVINRSMIKNFLYKFIGKFYKIQ